MDTNSRQTREVTPGAVVTAAPAWADLAPYEIPAAPNPHFIAEGVSVLLDESQIDLTGPDRAWLHRRAELITAPAGAEQAAQFSVTFDPTFERVEIHSVAVIRNGQRVEHALTGFFEVLRRERNLERMHFDGRLTLHLTLPDVRQGDVVESVHTLYGTRKALQNKHSAFIALEWSVGIIEVRLRLRRPAARAIAEHGYHGAPEASAREADGVIEQSWRTWEWPGKKFEALAPPWVMQSAALQMSEWRDWAEVADAFTPLYDEDGPLPAAFEAEAAQMAELPDDAQKAAAVLRFVQNAIRYHAISMGEGGYTPRALADIDATRYGDCKDKSKLFVQMARRLGLKACPALVNIRDGYALDDYLPSGQLFDHCVVRVEIGDCVYWLDPTLKAQLSPLNKMGQCHLGWALPLCADSGGLERMPDPPVGLLTETFESVQLGDGPDAPVRYEWEHRFYATRAEWMREQIAREGAVGLFKFYAESIQRMWPKARIVSQDIVSDDIEANALTIREIYEIDDAWTKTPEGAYRFSTSDLMLRGTLAKTHGPRTHPVYLGMPGVRKRKLTIKSVSKHSGSWLHGGSCASVEFSDKMEAKSPHLLVAEQKLEIKSMVLAPEDFETYQNVCRDLDNNDVVLVSRAVNGKFLVDEETDSGAHPVAFFGVIFVCLAAVGYLLRLMFGG